MVYDRKPDPTPHPLKLAVDLLNTELSCCIQAAKTIRDLYDDRNRLRAELEQLQSKPPGPSQFENTTEWEE